MKATSDLRSLILSVVVTGRTDIINTIANKFPDSVANRVANTVANKLPNYYNDIQTKVEALETNIQTPPNRPNSPGH